MLFGDAVLPETDSDDSDFEIGSESNFSDQEETTIKGSERSKKSKTTKKRQKSSKSGISKKRILPKSKKRLKDNAISIASDDDNENYEISRSDITANESTITQAKDGVSNANSCENPPAESKSIVSGEIYNILAELNNGSSSSQTKLNSDNPKKGNLNNREIKSKQMN